MAATEYEQAYIQTCLIIMIKVDMAATESAQTYTHICVIYIKAYVEYGREWLRKDIHSDLRYI